MKSAKHYGFNTRLVTVVAFTMAALLVAYQLPSAGNVIVDFVIVILLWTLLSTVAGLVANDSGLVYYVSLIFGITMFLTALFPYRYTDLMGIIGVMLGAVIGALVGFLANSICNTVQGYLRGEREFSLRRTLVYVLVFLGFLSLGGLGTLAYYNLADVIAYLDQHNWVVSLIGIIATFVLTFFGRGYFERKKREKR